MSGIQIEYLLGLYFIIVAISFTGGTFVADAFKLIAGIVLVVLAVLGISLIRF